MPDDISNNESLVGKTKYISGNSNQSKKRKTYSPDKIMAARLNKVNSYEERMKLQD